MVFSEVAEKGRQYAQTLNYRACEIYYTNTNGSSVAQCLGAPLERIWSVARFSHGAARAILLGIVKLVLDCFARMQREFLWIRF